MTLWSVIRVGFDSLPYESRCYTTPLFHGNYGMKRSMRFQNPSEIPCIKKTKAAAYLDHKLLE